MKFVGSGETQQAVRDRKKTFQAGETMAPKEEARLLGPCLAMAGAPFFQMESNLGGSGR